MTHIKLITDLSSLYIKNLTFLLYLNVCWFISLCLSWAIKSSETLPKYYTVINSNARITFLEHNSGHISPLVKTLAIVFRE